MLLGKIFRSLRHCISKQLGEKEQQSSNEAEVQEASDKDGEQDSLAKGDENVSSGASPSLCCVNTAVGSLWIILLTIPTWFAFMSLFSIETVRMREWWMCIPGGVSYLCFLIEMGAILFCVYENWFLAMSTMDF